MAIQANALLEVPLSIRMSWEDLVLIYRSECLCQVGLDPSIGVDLYLRGDLRRDACAKCYTKCLAFKLNLIDPATGKDVPSFIKLKWDNTTFPFQEECVCDSEVDPKLAYRAFIHSEYPDEACFRCYLLCLFLNLRMIDSQTGFWKEDVVLNKIYGTTPEIVSWCSYVSNNNTDLCDKAFQLHLCIFVRLLQEVPLEIRERWEQLVSRVRSECICEVGVKPALVDDFFLKGQFSTDPCVHCYIKCLAIKLNKMDAATGNINEYEYVRQVAGTTPAMISKCSNNTMIDRMSTETEDKAKVRGELLTKTMLLMDTLESKMEQSKTNVTIANISVLQLEDNTNDDGVPNASGSGA
ncbi:hypothetical protein RN001_000112 [Aquatica leii]|uniref:Uncharacterized protein n=1 Tax=Aquatica leii TaxID=1421715 RepID=A0AAN7PJL4_9COLE|nr:hypothetical protein RN001_000112 [Aquatica leii]